MEFLVVPMKCCWMTLPETSGDLMVISLVIGILNIFYFKYLLLITCLVVQSLVFKIITTTPPTPVWTILPIIKMHNKLIFNYFKMLIIIVLDDTCKAVLTAGLDIDCGSFLPQNLAKAVSDGAVSMDLVNSHLVNLFQVQVYINSFHFFF